ncbi:mercuric transporter MerT family protein [Roseiconus lacunae]|jgi:copper chaperone CopZ|uniref:mercuric transporter MerT family protein n=1 Tax=Pirellulaceae TaxID=2691357 RepID=UPI003088D3AC|nr:mercuric transporter MerT family protein [Stieleria sp. HD01]
MNKREETTTRVECPACGYKAKRVSTSTIGALLDDELDEQYVTDSQSCCATEGAGCASIKEDTGWRFCPSQNCDVVYFTEQGDRQFTKSQLKVSVGVKESSGERPLCYCFGHSVGSIKEELVTKNRSDALDDIRARMKDPGCHCETSNPSGSCCLGSVAKGIAIAQEEIRMNDSTVTLASTVQSSIGRGEVIAKIGTIVTAIMASACCWLPLIMLAIGVSGAGIAATLEMYRPLFIVITFGFLGAAFYFTYRPKIASAEAGHDCCPTESAKAEDCCAPTGKHRSSMMALNKVMLWGVTVLAVAFLFFPSYVGMFLRVGDDAALSESMNQAVFKIEGMTCEGCSNILAESIRAVPGILAVNVNFEAGEATVGTETCCAVPEIEVLEAIKLAGFKGKQLSLKK